MVADRPGILTANRPLADVRAPRRTMYATVVSGKPRKLTTADATAMAPPTMTAERNAGRRLVFIDGQRADPYNGEIRFWSASASAHPPR
jgi:hypothetical protein